MGSAGDASYNALCESFFATLECELLDRRRFVTQAQARLAVFDYIEGWSTRLLTNSHVEDCSLDSLDTFSTRSAPRPFSATLSLRAPPSAR